MTLSYRCKIKLKAFKDRLSFFSLCIETSDFFGFFEELDKSPQLFWLGGPPSRSSSDTRKDDGAPLSKTRYPDRIDSYGYRTVRAFLEQTEAILLHVQPHFRPCPEPPPSGGRPRWPDVRDGTTTGDGRATTVPCSVERLESVRSRASRSMCFTPENHGFVDKALFNTSQNASRMERGSTPRRPRASKSMASSRNDWNHARSVAYAMWKTVAACAFDALEILGERYLHAGRQSHGMGLSTPKYAWARIGLTLLIPIAVLNEYEPRFGIVGKLCVKWGEAYHHILCVLSPDAVQLVWTSSCRYTRGYAEASFHTCWGRTARDPRRSLVPPSTPASRQTEQLIFASSSSVSKLSFNNNSNNCNSSFNSSSFRSSGSN
ncbi:uncharacterized protein PITG_04852 [Phytophthora infestans T30-4]|uniref:Uncharacterized protein n=1 Tax=Phytophthora infestans (strain T30-4) TaxID=403677 RepID=D0N267_PHYIT|nr:uncharacterized protein PITG_04852 [Phytophthora infestans T30-4]EEY68396.1 hypothetical protein PITG_04852 [Phytophthora infestans T30-4]|eukprot:XP_002905555.1 hypothetical protein PITG_04852 [Phytophthora infestans T30-4]